MFSLPRDFPNIFMLFPGHSSLTLLESWNISLIPCPLHIIKLAWFFSVRESSPICTFIPEIATTAEPGPFEPEARIWIWASCDHCRGANAWAAGVHWQAAGSRGRARSSARTLTQALWCDLQAVCGTVWLLHNTTYSVLSLKSLSRNQFLEKVDNNNPECCI